MKYIGENAIKKLISLIKSDLATKQPTITASGLLKGDGAGTITAVDVPNGLLKGDGTTISAAIAETDYMAPPTGGTTGQVLKKTETGTEWADESGAADVVQSNLDTHVNNTTIHVTAEEKAAWNAKADASFKPEGKSYLTFSSPNSFTLAVGDATKHWDGTLEYFASDRTWTTWDGTTTLSSVDNDGDNVLYLRGTGNTVITGNSQNYRWILTGNNISCTGNIENLLDYATIEAGGHPTIANDCYGLMFYGCTALTQAPELPATTLAIGCYYEIFYGCTSLTQAPALPATTLADHCYHGMFYGCTSLTQAPALPATTLADSCYVVMFYGCTSLTQAPALPATTLADSCYRSMFVGCASLKLSSTQTDEYIQEYRIPSSGTGTTTSNALTGMFAGTGGTFTGTPEINTTYYLSSDNIVVRDTEIATLNGYVGSMIDAATSKSVSATLTTSGWTQSGNRYAQTVNVTGITASTPVVLVDVALSGTDVDADAAALEAWGIVSANNVAQGAGTLTFYAMSVPSVNIPVNVGVC